MEKLLGEKIGQQVEILCGTAYLSGKIVQIEDGVLRLENEQDEVFIAVQHIVYFKNVNDENKNQVGFGLTHSKTDD